LREAKENNLWNPKDEILWCGDGSSDFPVALMANIVLARQDTTLEKLCRANQIAHRVFTTFETVQEEVENWLLTHPENNNIIMNTSNINANANANANANPNSNSNSNSNADTSTSTSTNINTNTNTNANTNTNTSVNTNTNAYVNVNANTISGNDSNNRPTVIDSDSDINANA
ncbi:hypothetical protein BX616_008753, partial [Lobosporangium transversale]